MNVRLFIILIAFMHIPATMQADEPQPKSAGSAEGFLATTEEMIENLLQQIDRQKESHPDLIVPPPPRPIYRYTVSKGTNKQVIQRAIAAVKMRLKDPYSARFRNVHIGKERHRPVYGEVNAKNGFGGYVGYTWFTYAIINGMPHVSFDD